MTSLINTAFMKLSKRAEMNDRAKLVATFVNVGPLFTLISGKDHQVMYGRRGTGKTHVLSYLAEQERARGNAVIYIDLRTIGSTSGLYPNDRISIPQRATRLLADTLAEIHNALLEYFLQRAEEFDLSQTGPILDRLAETITEVSVTGTVEREQKTGGNTETTGSIDGELSAALDGVKARLNVVSGQRQLDTYEQRTKESGFIEYRLHFGSVGKAFAKIASAMHPRRVWLLLDEWSSLPLDLQPYLADLLRRTVFPVTNFSVKIAAIEQRAQFSLFTGHGDYIGIELGADAAADLNLDDFMVFDNDAERAKEFFQELLFKHFKETEGASTVGEPRSPTELIQLGFTQRNAFDEFVRAIEGVPRDAINIITLAAQKALNDRISINHVRTAARIWYQRDKESAVKSIPEAHGLLHWIIDEVIGHRHARAFLLKTDINHDLINMLFDSRVVHVLKRNISAHDQPGVRYDVYKLDYGCYVDLVTTARNPLGLLLGEQVDGADTFVDVPPDDYRAIRRAILDLDEFKVAKQ